MQLRLEAKLFGEGELSWFILRSLRSPGSWPQLPEKLVSFLLLDRLGIRRNFAQRFVADWIPRTLPEEVQNQGPDSHQFSQQNWIRMAFIFGARLGQGCVAEPFGDLLAGARSGLFDLGKLGVRQAGGDG